MRILLPATSSNVPDSSHVEMRGRSRRTAVRAWIQRDWVSTGVVGMGAGGSGVSLTTEVGSGAEDGDLGATLGLGRSIVRGWGFGGVGRFGNSAPERMAARPSRISERVACSRVWTALMMA